MSGYSSVDILTSLLLVGTCVLALVAERYLHRKYLRVLNAQLEAEAAWTRALVVHKDANARRLEMLEMSTAERELLDALVLGVDEDDPAQLSMWAQLVRIRAVTYARFKNPTKETT